MTAHEPLKDEIWRTSYSGLNRGNKLVKRAAGHPADIGAPPLNGSTGRNRPILPDAGPLC